MPGVDFQSDLGAIPRPDAAYDAIVCSHVLEHVADDRAAMRELHRVLAPGGWAVLQVPIAARAERTDEEPRDAPLPAEERARRFGDPTHRRLYAEADYVRRLEERRLRRPGLAGAGASSARGRSPPTAWRARRRSSSAPGPEPPAAGPDGEARPP